MDFSRTDEQELLLASIDEFFAQNPQFNEDYIRNAEEHRLPLTEYNLAKIEAGLGLLGIPEEHGGVEVDLQTMVMVAERINEHGMPSGLGQIMQIDDILAFGTELQQKEILSILAEGEMGFSLGLSEPGAGSDSNAIQTSYVRRDGKVIINGHKTFTTDGERAKYVLVMARDFSTDLPANKSTTTWLVPTNAPGVSVDKLHKVGHLTRTLNEMHFDDVEVDESALVGKEHEGFMVVMKNFEVERLVIAADALGMASCAYNDALRYATERIQFGKPIGQFQLIQELLVDMRIKVDNMRNMVYRAAWERDNGMSLRITSALAKRYCARTAFEVIDSAMQVLGGLGYTEHRVARLWRDARMYRIGGGTDEVMVHIAGRALQKEVVA